MKHFLVLALGVFSLAQISFAGALAGKAVFKGTAPKAVAIKMNADPVCAKANTGKTINKEDVVLGAGGSLENVVVYVKEGLKGAAPAAAATPVTLDQVGCMYRPHIAVLRTNQPLKIVNSDPTMHNVHSFPKANPGFNVGMATKGQTVEKKFAKPEQMIRVKCDVHGWMSSYIGVFDHPYFAVTDASGAFSIKDLPAGEYTVEAWHEKLGTKSQKVTVTDAGGSLEVTFN